MINRLITKEIEDYIESNKAIMLLGPRQVGKTTLIKSILNDKSFLFLDGDDRTITKKLSTIDTSGLRRLIGEHSIVFIDEAQKIPNIGNTLKIITDQFTHVKLFVSGSSSIDIHQHTQESLTGRKYELELFPISWNEFEQHFGYLESESQLENRMIFGMYPDVINEFQREKKTLINLTESLLYKDVLSLTGIRKPEILDRLLTALALQIGSEVSYNELAQLLGIDKNTVAKYINLLERSYVIFSLTSYSRNLRNEIKNSRKIYFYDNGIRNAIINNFAPIELRTDKGALWENFLIAERIKHNAYRQHYCKSFFWRTHSQQEVDYLEIADGIMSAFEFKWKLQKKVTFPKSMLASYQPNTQVIHRENFRDFLD